VNAAAPHGGTGTRRIERIDALRGLALLGIVQVNIQSYAWGSGPALGYLGDPAQPGESLLYFLQAAFFQGKFYPVFGFLFGASMALQLAGLRRHLGSAAAARARTRRRLAILLGIGLAHGVLLYFGDVLAAYALCGLLFLHLAPARLRDLLDFTRAAWVVAAATVFLPLLGPLLAGAATPPPGLPAAALQAHAAYTTGTYAQALGQRLFDEYWQQVGSAPLFWPQVIALMALGALAARLGWLHHPGRHRLLWRRAAQLGLAIGLPCALAGAALSLVRMRTAPGAEGGWADVLLAVSSVLAAAYVAFAVRLLEAPMADRVRRWLALAGRMSLSNYVGQSLAMGTLLAGWGLGLGAGASRGALALTGLGIFVLSVPLSRWLLARHGQGPLEALWRRWSYR